jgi:hypothetical protein
MNRCLLVAACVWVGGVAMAAEPPPSATPLAVPAWGAIDASAAPLGRYRFVIDRPPADGRLAVPAGFPAIMRATRAGDTAADVPVESDVPVEYSADAAQIAILVPAGDTAAGSVLAIETADATTQFDDGRIVFSARDARVTGAKARLEEHPGNARIGFWTDASDTVSWSRKASRWGMYYVRMT